LEAANNRCCLALKKDEISGRSWVIEKVKKKGIGAKCTDLANLQSKLSSQDVSLLLEGGTK